MVGNSMGQVGCEERQKRDFQESEYVQRRKMLRGKWEDTFLEVGIMDFSFDHTLPLVVTGPFRLCAMS